MARKRDTITDRAFLNVPGNPNLGWVQWQMPRVPSEYSGGSLSIGDCSRSVQLEFPTGSLEETRDSIVKVGRLRRQLERLESCLRDAEFHWLVDAEDGS